MSWARFSNNTNWRCLGCGCALVLSLLLSSEVSAQLPLQKLLASDGAAQDSFGSSVSMSGDVIVVSAPHDNDVANNSGSVYVYRLAGTTWIEEQKLLASDAAENDGFGTVVAVGSDVIVVSAPGDDDLGISAGSAYVFRHNGLTWIQEQKLLATYGCRVKRTLLHVTSTPPEGCLSEQLEPGGATRCQEVPVLCGRARG